MVAFDYLNVTLNIYDSIRSQGRMDLDIWAVGCSGWYIRRILCDHALSIDRKRNLKFHHNTGFISIMLLLTNSNGCPKGFKLESTIKWNSRAKSRHLLPPDARNLDWNSEEMNRMILFWFPSPREGVCHPLPTPSFFLFTAHRYLLLLVGFPIFITEIYLWHVCINDRIFTCFGIYSYDGGHCI
jgi:hypothetical protein